MATSVVVGIVLALAYHFLSLLLQRRFSSQKGATALLATVGGFVIRIAVLMGILVILGLWSGLNIIAVCIAFISLFTILNAIWIYFAIKKRDAISTKGASGA